MGDAESRAGGWHGWGTDAWSLHVGPLPDRKSICLYYHSGSVVDALAFFRDHETAFRALVIIDRLVHGTAHNDDQERP